jgi:DHA3 family tetracycline resistance protein-like MFS transporter
MVIGIVATGVAARRIKTSDSRQAARGLVFTNSALLLTMAGFALAVGFGLALASFLLTQPFRTIQGPVYTAWLNHGVAPGVRATVLSMGGQADAFGQLAGGPALGLLASQSSIQVAIVATSLLLLPAIAVYLWLSRRPNPSAVATAAE